MKEVEIFIGPCSKYITGQGWTTEIPVEQLKAKGYQKENPEQKAEIERLTEENGNISQSYIEVCDINAELQKQVDELKQEKLDAVCDLNMRIVELDNELKQTVKDTAKGIYKEIGKGDILVVQTQEYGEIEVVSIERLKEIIKSKGVEVEE